MTLLPPYDIGTVTLTNGSADIVGNDTAWAVNGVTGGLMTVEAAGGNPLLLADVADDTTATAATKWMGPSGTFKYAISLESAQAADVVWANRHWSRVVGQGLLAAIRPDASGTLAERDALNPQLANGQWFARAEPPHDLEFYRKVPGGWHGPFATRGVAGVGEGGLGLPSPGAANKMPYYSGADTISLTDLTEFGRDLVGAADPAAAHDILGTATLEGLAGLTTAANKMPYFTGPGGAAALADLTAFGRALAALTGANGSIPVATGAGTVELRAILGTVSQAGGIPTGALMEAGSNANGLYARWTNGWQVCIGNRTLAQSMPMAYLGGFRGMGVHTVALPASYINANSYEVALVAGGPNEGPVFGWLENRANRTPNSFQPMPLAVTSQSEGARYLQFVTAGRWF